jgi:hypothetical protein
MCGWMRQSAELLVPLYQRLKHFVFDSKVVGTDDTPVKVLDRNLSHTRKGRFWPYVGDRSHPAVVYDYTPTRERAGPEQFLKTCRGYLQADACVACDSFFTDPARGLVEVGCWAHYPECDLIQTNWADGSPGQCSTVARASRTPDNKRVQSVSRNASSLGEGRHTRALFGDSPARFQKASSTSRFICKLVVM